MFPTLETPKGPISVPFPGDFSLADLAAGKEFLIFDPISPLIPFIQPVPPKGSSLSLPQGILDHFWCCLIITAQWPPRVPYVPANREKILNESIQLWIIFLSSHQLYFTAFGVWFVKQKSPTAAGWIFHWTERKAYVIVISTIIMLNENNNNNMIIIISFFFILPRKYSVLFWGFLEFSQMHFSWSWGCQSLRPSPIKTSSLF